ncbi:polysaccharide biosynthesis tyrosine autokinase [Bifidobacterium vansinderenii]|uniref:non-specific protein-tyrosine kinase n=1 Tax=Bifidobacterium vansinderenii TaxID=1984871 RepID=A0A229VWJ7_9BIFI|nr:polysaccharide biosynthesis tyrosine autokinase [Bifidobacterium vansinderenii]OXN00008.1 lipopolysaccharide biosynthesis protein [Bifidobacterium vansinderenii]
MEKNDAEEKDVISIDIIGAVRKHLAALIVTFVVVTAAVCGYTFMQTPQYSATAEVFASYKGVSSDNNQNTDMTTRSYATSYINTQLQSYPQLVKTEAILQPVIDEMGLNTTVSALAGKITAQQPTDTFLVDITATDPDPKVAADLANNVAKSLKDQVSSTLYSSDASESSPINLSIVQSAQVPTTHSSPNIKMNIAIGIVGGLVLGLILAIVLDLLDHKIRQASDLQDILDVPVLGALTRNDVYAGKAPVVISRPASREAEEIRRLRMNLTYVMPDKGEHSNLIVITSAGVSEGKTTTSVNLAAAYAEAGKKILLIDADLRNPSVAKALSMNGTVGLSQLLTYQVKSTDAIQQYWKENFHVLPAGKRAPNPGILFNSKAMKSLLDQVSGIYDYVIIDTAPLKVANDAAVFVKEGATMLFVSGLGHGEKKDVRAAAEELETLDVTVAGAVLNFSEEEKSDDNYYYYYSDGEDGKSRRKRRSSSKKTSRKSKKS